MWIMTSYGVLMPADLPEKHRLRKHPEWDMQIRARDRAALAKLRARMRDMGFATSAIRDTHSMDYEYRIYCDRDNFAQLMVWEIMKIDYTKFKPTTERRGGGGRSLHNLYDSIWYVVARHYGSIPTVRTQDDDETEA